MRIITLPVVAIIALATQQPALAADQAPKQFRISLEQNGHLEQMTLSAVIGATAPAASIQTTSYTKECGPDSTGKIVTTPGEVSTGLKVSVAAVSELSDGVMVTMNFDYSSLVGMRETKMPGADCKIEMPITHHFDSSGLTFVLKPGQSYSITDGAAAPNTKTKLSLQLL